MALEPRATQIIPLELLPGALVTHYAKELIRGTDLTWYCDNTAAVAAAIKGASSSRDLCRLSTSMHLAWAKLGVRTWVEWVDSDSNAADAISREGKTAGVEEQLGITVDDRQCFRIESLLEAGLAGALDALLDEKGNGK